MILIHSNKQFLVHCKKEISRLCHEVLDLELNQKTQIGIVKNGLDFLGYRHIVGSSGRLIVKLRYSSKQRMKKHLKTLYKLYDKGIVDETYVLIRKNAFYNHVKRTNECFKMKEELLSRP